MFFFFFLFFFLFFFFLFSAYLYGSSPLRRNVSHFHFFPISIFSRRVASFSGRVKSQSSFSPFVVPSHSIFRNVPQTALCGEKIRDVNADLEGRSSNFYLNCLNVRIREREFAVIFVFSFSFLFSSFFLFFCSFRLDKTLIGNVSLQTLRILY